MTRPFRRERKAGRSTTAIHTVSRVADLEPVQRNEMTAEKKLIAESLLEEVKIQFNTKIT
jgi:hypothetical protein